MRISPAEPSPGDAPPGVPGDAPVSRPGDRRHDIEPMRPPIVTPRPSGVLHLDPDAILANSGAQDERTPCREALCRTALVANSEATRIASSAHGQPPSHPASAARASPTCRGSAG